MYTYDEVFTNCKTYFNGDELATSTLVNKYLLRDKNDKFLESKPEDVWNRLALEFARIEKKYPNSLAYEQIYGALKDFKYIIPQGSPLFGIGNTHQIVSIANCYVIPSPQDNYSSIIQKDEEIVNIAKRRGGIGIDMSTLRPKGMNINNAAKSSEGVTCFMERYSNTTKEVAQCIEKTQRVIVKNEGFKQIQCIRTGDEVWTNTGYVKVLNVLTNKKQVYKVSTERGYSIQISADHVCIDGDNFEKPLKEFKIGESITLSYGTGIDKPLLPLQTEFTYNFKRIQDFYKISKYFCKEKFEYLSSDLAYLLGFSYGDGYIEYDKFNEPMCLSIAVEDKRPQILLKLVKILDHYNITYTHLKKHGQGHCSTLNINNKLFLEFLNVNGLLKQKALQLILPKKITDSNTTVQAAFISGYFDADGCSMGYKRGFLFSSINQSFLQGIQTLLLSMGIVSRLSCEKRYIKNWHDLYSLNVTGKHSQQMFVTHMKESVKTDEKPFIASRDSVKTSFKQDIHKMSLHTFNMLCKKKEWPKNHLFTDKIKEIQLDEITDTYDLQLESEHKFWCEGFYVHNSGRRGALMISLDCRHPDILDFILIKRNLTRVTGANISVRWHDDFLKAVEQDKEFTLRFPVDAKIEEAKYTKKVKAKDIWNEFIKSAWMFGEPGCLFWDSLVKNSLSDCYKDLGFNTISTNPCGELPLSAYGSCILLAMNLTGFVEQPFTDKAKFNYGLFEEKLNIASKLVDDMIDIELEKIDQLITKIKSDPETLAVKQNELHLWEQVKQNYLKGRRVGLGITGLGDCMAMLNLKYDSDKALEKVEKIFKLFHTTLMMNNTVLAKERSKFPIWDWEREKDCHYIKILPKEVQEAIKENGRRNISLTTVAPAGSISMLSRTTSGIEPVFARAYKRNRKMTPEEIQKGIKEAYIDADGIKWLSYEVIHHGLKQWLDMHPGKKIEDSPYWGCEANELKWQYRVKLQGTIQKYITHSISNTYNLHKDVAESEVNNIYLAAWKEGCKGVTIYRDGCRKGVLETKDKHDRIVESYAPKRPNDLECDIYYSTVEGKSWVFFVGLLHGRPYEIFGGKKDKIEIPKKYKKGWIVKNGKNDDDVSTYDLYLGTLEDSDERIVIKDIASEFSPGIGTHTRSHSTMLRHGIPIKYICEQLYKDSANTHMYTFEKCMARCLKHYIKDGEKAEGVCVKCGSNSLQYRDGCVYCVQCGDSKCN